MSSCRKSSCRTNCWSISQLSPCTPLPSLAQSRCSSVLLTDHCQDSRLSCGSLSPICCDTANNNEIKIIITDPHNNSVFSSVHEPYGRENQNTVTQISSPFLSSIHNVLHQPWSRGILIFWTVLVPAMVGLMIGLTMGWTSLPGLAVSACLFFASVSLLVIIISIMTARWLSLQARLGPQYCPLPGDTCLSPATHRENSIISCAEKKISRTEFFTVD